MYSILSTRGHCRHAVWTICKMSNTPSYKRMSEPSADGNGPLPVLITDNTDVIKEKLLKRIRIYCCLTGQYWSFKETAKKAVIKRILYGLWQAMIVIFALIYFVYSFACFGLNMKVDRLSLCFYFYPVSLIEQAVWEFRWLATCLMGIVCTRGIWKKLFEKGGNDEGISLNTEINIRWPTGILLGLFFAMWFFSELSIYLEISSNFSDPITRSEALRFSLDAIAALVDRLVAFPLFFFFASTCIYCAAWLKSIATKSKKRKVKIWRERSFEESRLPFALWD